MTDRTEGFSPSAGAGQSSWACRFRGGIPQAVTTSTPRKRRGWISWEAWDARYSRAISFDVPSVCARGSNRQPSWRWSRYVARRILLQAGAGHGESCCHLNDCRPTLSRMISNHYEILLDGRWTAVPLDTIRKVTAPDRGVH